MAGDPLFSEALIGFGITSLSMSSVAIPAVRAEISHIRYSLAKRFALRAVRMGTGAEILDAMQRRSKQRSALEEYLDLFSDDDRDSNGKP